MTMRHDQGSSLKRAVMILAVASSLFLASCLMSKAVTHLAGRSDMGPVEAFIQEEVRDPGRADRMKEVVKELKQELKAFQTELANLEVGYAKLNAKYDARADEFETFFAGFDAKRKGVRAKLLDAHFRLKELASPQERQRMLELEAQALREAMKLIAQPARTP